MRRIAVGMIVFVGIAALIVVPILRRERDSFSTTPCMLHLHQLGMAILLYANDHNGAMPDSFATILRTQDVTRRDPRDDPV